MNIIVHSSALPLWQQNPRNTVVLQLGTQRQRLEEIARRMTRALLDGNKILWCGNGGSGTDAQHLATELVGRYRRGGACRASIALTENGGVILGIASDYGFNEVFARQVEALCQPEEVLVGISTLGNSRNVALALERAMEMGSYSVPITSEHGGRIGSTADTLLRIPSSRRCNWQCGGGHRRSPHF